MKCPSLEELAAYENGSLAREQRTTLDAHLGDCAQCRQELTALRATARLLAAMPAPEMPDDLWPGVAARLQASPRPQRWVRWWKVAMGAGVAASLFIGLAVTRLQPPPSMPLASAAATPYVTEHEFLSAQDPLADRASLGVLLAAQQGGH
ncbi:MAG: anti-sigma factor family protein [Armatimonadota bacterium]